MRVGNVFFFVHMDNMMRNFNKKRRRRKDRAKKEREQEERTRAHDR